MEFEQMDLSMIFNGKGRVWIAEHECYHPKLHVYFQQWKASADRAFCARFAEKTIKPYVQKFMAGEECLLFLDNFDSQKTKPFVDRCVFGPPHRTEWRQPIDVGHIGAIRKSLGKDKFEAIEDGLNENGDAEAEADA